MEIDPDAPFPYRQLAQLLRSQGKTSEAAKYDQRGSKASHRYAEAQNLRGTELTQQGKIREAIAKFQMAVAADPDYAQAHNNLADALALQGDIDGAIAHYNRALEIDPNFAPPGEVSSSYRIARAATSRQATLWAAAAAWRVG